MNLRDELAKLGISLHDAPNGTHWEVAKVSETRKPVAQFKLVTDYAPSGRSAEGHHC